MKNVLLLNRAYTPVGIIPWRKAVGLVIGRSRAETLLNYSQGSSQFRPAVIKLTVPSPDPYTLFRQKGFCRKKMFLRDNFKCQYCSKDISLKEGTVDHIIPRSLGGPTSFLNCVAACKRCNQKKGSRTLEQSGLKLLDEVRKPTIYDIFNGMDLPKEWEDFLNL